METDVILTAEEITEEKVINKTAVVIDVLRASSTIVTALANGADRILPVASVDKARELAKSLSEACLIAGERGGVQIEGFDLDNSPRQFLSQKIKNQSIVLTTTNGTKCFTRLEAASQVLVGSLLNSEAVSKRLTNREVVLCCAGQRGEVALDDFLGAGKIIAKLESKNDLELSDTARAAKDLYFYYKEELKKNFKITDSGQGLIEKGKEKDIDFILENNYDVVPIYEEEAVQTTDS